MCVRCVALSLLAAFTVAGCAHDQDLFNADGAIFGGAPAVVAQAPAPIENGYPQPIAAPIVTVAEHSTTGEPANPPMLPPGPQAVADSDGPYLLDSGDRLRVFVYGQPNLSRIYTVDHGGMITVPLIGAVKARGLSTFDLEGVIRRRLGAEYVRNPQVTVDVQQNRPFFILGEVRNSGQYPYVSGMTVQTAIAIAGGYTERASDRTFRITRRVNGYVEQVEAPSDYVVKPGDTIFVYERFL
ncbi:MAG: polysaccharide export protein [Hyphomicrobiaceae bacterium]|nr:polysaccharide export protein [Hyphomicrobiaceae bacterium]MCC0008592.1 polysaccharide export protein [Hyphomicrobiaceae bacterium]